MPENPMPDNPMPGCPSPAPRSRLVSHTRALLLVLAVLGALGGLAVVGASPATAGGPTSVLLVAQGTGRTASLSFQDSDYAALEQVLREQGAEVPTVGSDGTRPSVTATWLIHDVQVWRVDRIDLGAPGGPVVTTEEWPVQEGGTAQPVSRRVARPAELTALLTRLGVLPGPAVEPSSEQTVAAVDVGATSPPPSPDESSDPEAVPAADGGSGMVWGLGGATLGAALALGGRALVAGRAEGWRRRRDGDGAIGDSDADEFEVELTR